MTVAVRWRERSMTEERLRERERENDVKTVMVPGINKALSQLRHYKMEMPTSA